MIEKGFPPSWIGWVLTILQTSSSSIRINGTYSASFQHKRGLRQGDPLSPLLFNLVVDALQDFMRNAFSLLPQQLFLRPTALQYADDTIIVMEADPQTLKVVAEILRNFTKLTGLHINYNKGAIIPISISSETALAASAILGCSQKELPITYLGIPLSAKKLKKADFLPMVQAIQNRLEGWKGRFLSIGGRLTLLNSILSAMPLHFMQVIRLPAWLLKHLNRIRRNFFWKGNERCLGGHCLVSWKNCCLPKKIGGIGILNLDCQNQALLQKWLWKLRTEPDSVWVRTITMLYGTSDTSILSQFHNISYSLRDILDGVPFVNISITLNPQDDKPCWRWTPDGTFSSSSTYRLLIDAGMRNPTLEFIWKIKAPTKVKIFIWLLLKDKLLTQVNLQKRNWPSIPNCILCTTLITEDVGHLFVHCNFVKAIWLQINDMLRSNNIVWHGNIIDTWWKNRYSSTRSKAVLWDSIWAAGCWLIWKERNTRIFNNSSSIPARIASDIIVLSRQWFSNC